MKKRILVLCACTTTLFLAQCSPQQAVAPESTTGERSVKVAIVVPEKYAPLTVKTICSVSAPDMETITQELTYLPPNIVGTIPKIPCGANRLFSIEVFGKDGIATFSGESYAAILAHDTTYVRIMLKKASGSAIIQGFIEDSDNTDEVIDTPATPNIVDWYAASDTTVVLYMETTPCASSLGDPIIYRWDLEHSGNGNWVGTKSYVEACSLSISEDGIWSATVTALCEKHPDIFSKSTKTAFTKKGDTLLFHTPSDPDITPPYITKTWGDTVDVMVNDTLNMMELRALDDRDGDITDRIIFGGDVIWGLPGQYELILTCTDNAGNTAVDKTVVAIRNPVLY